MTTAAPGRAAFAFIFITVALDMLALGVMIPVLPKLIVSFQGGDVAQASIVVGVFGFAWALMQFLFQPLLGALSDRYGRRPIILLSNLGLGADYVLMALAPNIVWLFVGRLISGFAAASFSTASAYIADITPAEGRAARFGMLGAAFGLGFVIGPAIGGWLGAIDLRLPFWGAAALSLLNFAYGLFVLPESLSRDKRTPRFVWASAIVGGAWGLLRSSKTLGALGLSAFLYYLAHESLPAIFVLYTDHRFGWDPAEIGAVLTAVGVGSMIVSGGVVRTAVNWLGEWRALAVGLAFGAASFAVYALAPTPAIFFVGIPLGAIWGLAGPAEQALMSREVGADAQGQLQGALGSIRGVAGMVAPLLFAQIFAASVKADAFAGAAYLLASLLLVASLAVAWSGKPK